MFSCSIMANKRKGVLQKWDFMGMELRLREHVNLTESRSCMLKIRRFFVERMKMAFTMKTAQKKKQIRECLRSSIIWYSRQGIVRHFTGPWKSTCIRNWERSG